MSDEHHNHGHQFNVPEEEQKLASEKADQAVKNGCMGSSALPPIDFNGFVLSMAHQAMTFLGLIPHPETKQMAMHLPSAKQTIDILTLLEEKTRGNLSPAEARLLSHILYDLRNAFISKCRCS